MAKELTYGDPDESDIRMMGQSHPLIPIEPLELPLVPVPPNTEDEILKVLEASASPKLPVQVRRLCDVDLTEPFRIVLEERGIPFPEEEIDEIRENLKPIVLKLKYHFNRPRPWQVAEALGIKFVFDRLASATSPAYPSGHTMASYIIAGFLVRLYPELVEEIYTAAEMVALSRIEAGVHFPSDNLYAMILAEEILEVTF